MTKLTAIILAVLMIFCLSTESFGAAKSAVLIDGKTGRVLFEYNKDEKLPMASTTKIMTALIALEEENKDDYFVVNKAALAVEGSSMGLLEGDRVNLRTLAVGMLLASGNDAANAAAIKISGSVEKFVQLMNTRAKELGLKNTSFETPSGLDGENHYSTAYDMALLAKYALQNPDFAEICSKKSIKVEFGNPPYSRWLLNHNRLLKDFEGTVGVKTGFTKKAGRCLVSAVEREEILLICVTLCCANDWEFHKNIYNEYFSKLESVPLESLVEKIEIPVSGGTEKTVTAVPKRVSAALFDDEKQKVKVKISKEPFVFAPVEKGKIIGTAYFYIENELVAKTPLLAEENIETLPENKGFWDEIKEIF